eukprot:TRINITY_DN695_c0_g6_i1.p1 TRINITY_DN695_c0_g6~~TRINITY_DN695_c0_g6_i1.p1  ORF type:complete len:461 (+),score=101.92 TRINITY_DN695_c0_g6_i1:32-1414(+)
MALRLQLPQALAWTVVSHVAILPVLDESTTRKVKFYLPLMATLAEVKLMLRYSLPEHAQVERIVLRYGKKDLDDDSKTLEEVYRRVVKRIQRASGTKQKTATIDLDELKYRVASDGNDDREDTIEPPAAKRSKLESETSTMASLEPIKCSYVACGGNPNCEFIGGFSGYCSSCWKSLSDDDKRRANAIEVAMQPEREKFWESHWADVGRRQTEELKRRKQEASNTLKAENQERTKNMKEGRCYLVAGGYNKTALPETKQYEKNPCAVDMEDGVRLYSCGLLNIKLPFNHEHKDSDRIDVLSRRAKDLTAMLTHVKLKTGTTSPWDGFFVCVADNAHLFKTSESQSSSSSSSSSSDGWCSPAEILQKIVLAKHVGEEKEEEEGDSFECEELSSSSNFFLKPNEKASQEVKERTSAATELFKAHGRKDSFYRVQFHSKTKQTPCFVVALTKDGDMFGVHANH